MDSETIIAKYKDQIRENRSHRDYEKKVGADRAYFAYDSDVKTHDAEFKRPYPEGLKKWVVDRKVKIGRTPSMLVLMGQVGLMREVDVHGVAVALTDDRKPEERQEDELHKRELVEGDLLLYKKTFHQVRESMQRHAINSIDLAILRGYQGNNWLTDSVAVQGKVLTEVINLLDPNGGELTVHSGTKIPQKELDAALSKLSQCPQIQVEHFKSNIGLTTDIKFTKRGEVDLEEFWKST